MTYCLEKRARRQLQNLPYHQNWGEVHYNFEKLSAWNLDRIRERYIAFDVETTGLEAGNHRIIEIAAVVFENGTSKSYYRSLVKSVDHVPSRASAINHITDELLAKGGQDPAVVYKEFTDFVGDAIDGKTPLVAHNAPFDCAFLKAELQRAGYSADIRCLDTLRLSQQLVDGLESYKQTELAKHFGIDTGEAHRACDDAEVCGKILWELTNIYGVKAAEEKIQAAALAERYKMTERMMAYCGCIANSLLPKLKKPNRLQFTRDLSGYVSVCCIGYTVSKFKFSAKFGAYIIVRKDAVPKAGLLTEKCSSSEGEDFVRVYFRLPEDADWVCSVIAKEFEQSSCQWDEIEKYGGGTESEMPLYHIVIRQDEIQGLLEKLDAMNAEEDAAIREKEDAEAQKAEERRLKEEQKAQKQEAAQKRREEIDAIHAAGGRLATDKRKVIQYDDDHNVIAEYESVTQAAAAVESTPKSIRDACSGKQKHAAGYVWKYADQVE